MAKALHWDLVKEHRKDLLKALVLVLSWEFLLVAKWVCRLDELTVEKLVALMD